MINTANQRTCINNPDEKPPEACASTAFECDNKRCVLKNFLCDGDNDCMDNSDERGCAGGGFLISLGGVQVRAFSYI